MLDLSTKRVLLTGGSGFLGQYVEDALYKHGCTDVFIPEHKDYDLRRREAIQEVFRISNPDVVIHMAAALGGIEAHVNTQGQFLYENLIMGLEMRKSREVCHHWHIMFLPSRCSHTSEGRVFVVRVSTRDCSSIRHC